MHDLSVRDLWAPDVEVGMIQADRFIERPADMRENLRWEYQTRRDERLFDYAWLVNGSRREIHRASWQQYLTAGHRRFLARLEAL